MTVLRSTPSRLVPLAGLVLAAAAAPAACSSSGTVSVTTGQDGGSPEASTVPVDGSAGSDAAKDGSASAAPVARFSLPSGTTPSSFLDVPFPTDAYLANGSVIAAIPGLENTIPNDTSFINYGLSKLNGFSRLALSIFAVDSGPFAGDDAGATSAKIDPATLPVAETECQKPGSSVYLIDLANGALLPCRAAFHDDQPRAKTTPVIALGPPRGYLLAEAHQYAAVLTSRVKDTSGRAVTASADFTALAAGKAPAGPITTMYAAAYASANAALKAALATDGATIVSIAPFTTMRKTQELFAMRDALEASAAPTLAWDATSLAPMGAAKFAAVSAAPDGGTSDAGAGPLPAGFAASLDAWLGVVAPTAKLPDGTDDPDNDLPVPAHDQIAAVGTAVFQAKSYLQVKPGGYNDQDHATFAYDANGNPVAQADVPIWVTFATPKTPMPAAGYPVVIVQHGLGGSRDFIVSLANTFTKKGWMVAAIDSVTFGARASEAANRVDATSDFKGTTTTYTGPDGLADSPNGSTDLFGSLQSILAIRDQFREAGFDTAQLVKVLRSNPDLSALNVGSGNPAIDPARVAYIGDSLGAMEGTIGAALEPNVQAWYLNVNAGSLFPELAAHSPEVGRLLTEAAGFNFGIVNDTFSWSHPLLQVLETIIEPGDPISYAEYLTTSPQKLAGTATKARNAVQVEAIWDYFVTDEGSEAIARAAGWSLGTPNVGSNADVTDLSQVADGGVNPRATPFTQVDPDDAGAIHDTPAVGVTAVLIQSSPAEHGSNLVSSSGNLDFKIPFAPPFVQLGAPIPFHQDYRGLQNVALTFFDDAFQGKVPRVIGANVPAPVGPGFAVPVRTAFDAGN